MESGELELAVLPDEVGQLRGNRAEGCLWAGWVPSERVDPGGVVHPHPRPPGTSLNGLPGRCCAAEVPVVCDCS